MFQPATFGWHAVAAIATLVIALLVLRLTHDIGLAVDAKVDRPIGAEARTVPPEAAEIGGEREL